MSVGVLAAVGLGLRVAVADQSLFADELSTYWIVSSNGLGGVVATVHGDAEITPPLYFVLAWLTTRIDLTPELLRAPSLVAGVAAIPLTYLLGLRTVGRWPGLVGAALVTLSPFMIYYSAEARGYALAIALVLLSTLALLAAVRVRRLRWWVAYAACSCVAVLTHYTSGFALAAQLGWLLFAHPEARRPALLANAAAALAFLPWLSGLINDFNSPTTSIVNALDVLNLHTARVTLEHWVVGYPYAYPNTSLGLIPGPAALVLLALGVAVAVCGTLLGASRRGLRGWLAGADRGLILVVALALSGPVGVVVASAVGTNVVSIRHLGASWPAFALTLATLLLAAGPRLRFAALALVVASFAIGAARMLEPRFARPDYRAAAAFVDRDAAPGDTVMDVTNLSPGPITAMDAAFDRSRRLFYVGRFRIRLDPFKILALPQPTARVTRRAAAAARGGRVFIVASETVGARSAPTRVVSTQEVIRALPAGYRRTKLRTYPGILRVAVLVYAPASSPRG